jgi:hypothetical protein
MSDDMIKTYEDGKNRRYKLLFAVNGGAFAIAKYLKEGHDASEVLGSLELWHLGVGMALFTAIMVADIYAFGMKMKEKDATLFALIGKVVLVSIGALLVAGWSIASVPKKQSDWALAAPMIGILVYCSILGLFSQLKS